MRRPIAIFGVFLVLAAVVWGACAYLDIGGQRQLFHFEGRHLLSDYYMPWKCANEGYAQPPELEYTAPDGRTLVMSARDRCYPAFALLPFRVLPYSVVGGMTYSLVGAAFLLFALVMIAEGRPWPLLLVGAMPFLYSVERGNPVWFCAAGIAVFLAWWDDESKVRRTIAAVCLAAAALFKVSPIVLGAVYLFPRARDGRRDWTSMSVAAVAAVVFFVLPWLAMPNGFADIPVFLTQARENGTHHVLFCDFGLVQIWRTIRVIRGQILDQPWPGLTAVTFVSQTIGILAVFLGAWKRRYVLLVGGLLLAAGNMRYYGSLYLLPVFVLMVLRQREAITVAQFALWAVLFCPLQLPIMGHGANFVLGNLALLGLMALDARELVIPANKR